MASALNLPPPINNRDLPQEVNTAFTNLNQGIAERIYREKLFIVLIKRAIQGLQGAQDAAAPGGRAIAANVQSITQPVIDELHASLRNIDTNAPFPKDDGHPNDNLGTIADNINAFDITGYPRPDNPARNPQAQAPAPAPASGWLNRFGFGSGGWRSKRSRRKHKTKTRKY